MPEKLVGSLYDHPLYYDLVFGSDWKAEFEFLKRCFPKHVTGEVKSVFEPACGTGRLLYRLAQQGLEVSGLDLNPAAIKFCNDRLVRKGVPVSTFVGDMTDFQLDQPVDAAFNTINSFRHLATEQMAVEHLCCVRDALRPGGIYVLGLHLFPTAIDPVEDESWSAQRGNLCVNTTLALQSRDPENRFEKYSMTMDVYTPTRHLRLNDSIDFRTYTLPEMLALLEKIECLEIEETYDFAYRMSSPIKLDDSTEDVVFILKRT
ncbi:MAG: SAM-dependent methyltransferase [Pirellulaceae bacterium]|jgi:SAM-dependent methyltransferase